MLSDKSIIIISTLLIIPFLLLSFFVHPAADDFIYHNTSKSLGFFDAQKFWYLNWSGRYVSSALSSILVPLQQPFVIYKFLPVVLLIAFYFSLYQFWANLIRSLKKSQYHLLSIFFTISYLYALPTVSEGVYWLGGSITYFIPCILSLILISLIISLLRKNNINILLLTVFVLFFVIGANETTMLITDYLLLVLLLNHYYKKRRINSYLLVVFIFAIIFSLIVVVAPGNSFRLEEHPDSGQILFTVLSSILSTKTFLILWLPFTTLLSLLIFSVLEKDIKLSKTPFIDYRLLILITISVIFLGFLPGFWSLGTRPPARTINVIYFYFILLYILSIFEILRKVNMNGKKLIKFSPMVGFAVVTTIVVLLLRENNIKTALTDLTSGSAYNYHQAFNARYEEIENCQSDPCEISPIKNKPKSIWLTDITDDMNDWRNKPYAEFFGKKSIKLLNKQITVIIMIIEKKLNYGSIDK